MGEELGFFCLNYHCKTEKGRKKVQKQNKKKIKMNGVN